MPKTILKISEEVGDVNIYMLWSVNISKILSTHPEISSYKSKNRRKGSEGNLMIINQKLKSDAGQDDACEKVESYVLLEQHHSYLTS